VQLTAVQAVAVGAPEGQRDHGTDPGDQRPPEVGVDHRLDLLGGSEGCLLLSFRKHIQQLPASPA